MCWSICIKYLWNLNLVMNKYTPLLYILFVHVQSLCIESWQGGCGKNFLTLLAPGFWILVIPLGGTQSARIWLSKFSWYTKLSQKNMLTKKFPLGGCGPKNGVKKNMFVFFLQLFICLPKISSVMNANYVEKNCLPLYFFLLLNILLLKEIILQITLFYLQIKKSNTKIAVMIYLKNCKF